ncbi:MAG TPA: sigma-70 family RNA polymerase sigma factor [Ktedonobacteraceae bacterium]|nr:sigma-70 family RNA polymerase sigma factor [Ktedonobacteraceae bacterium]
MQHNDPSTRGKAIEELFEQHGEKLFAFLRMHTLSREDAEDILVETFTAALTEIKFAHLCESEQTAWLWRVARNKVVDEFRRANVRRKALLEQMDEPVSSDETHDPEQMALRQDEAREVHEMLQHLSAQQQEVLRLRFGYGLQCREIALILGKRENTVRVMLSRAMNLLRQLYSHPSSTSR